MTLSRKLALIGAFVATVATTKPAHAQILTGLLGAATGTATGGYITLSLAVPVSAGWLEARSLIVRRANGRAPRSVRVLV